MAQYKVIQDIEAEDKLVGPFSLRQFIYAGIAAIMGYLCVISVSRGAPFLVALWIPPMLFCMFFAWPWSPDQPTEVWALARIRFLFKPRKRIWDQSGMKDLVTITVPKRVQKAFTNGLSQSEVKSRLTALADTIDSRGWAVKNAAISMPALPAYDQAVSDRLVATSALPQTVSDIDIEAGDDILDAQNNRIAQQFDQMIQVSSQAHRQKLLDEMRAPVTEQPVAPPQPSATANAAQTPADYWFLNQPAATNSNSANPSHVVFADPTLVQPGANQSAGPVAATPTPAEEALGEELLKEHTATEQTKNQHLKTITPLGQQTDAANPVQPPVEPVTAPSDAAILSLASNNDLNVATIARQAHKARNPEPPEDEVVVSLR